MPGGGCGLSAVAFCSLSFLLFRASESRASEFPLLPLFRNSLFHSPPTHRLLSLSAGSTRSSRREPIQALHVRSRLNVVQSCRSSLRRSQSPPKKKSLTAIATVSIPLLQSRRDRIDPPVSLPSPCEDLRIISKSADNAQGGCSAFLQPPFNRLFSRVASRA